MQDIMYYYQILALKNKFLGCLSFFLILLLSSCSSFFVRRDDEAKWIHRHFKCSKLVVSEAVRAYGGKSNGEWGYVRVGSSGKKYYGYWNGGTLQMFTPIRKDANSPWISYNRIGKPNLQLWQGLNSWEGSPPSAAKELKCIPSD